MRFDFLSRTARPLLASFIFASFQTERPSSFNDEGRSSF
jgi:hypothetical protein